MNIKDIIKKLHRFDAFRYLAKFLLKNVYIQQPFYDGKIVYNAVFQSQAFIGYLVYDKFDRNVQDRLNDLCKEKELFIDIGCNIGVMTLAVLLRNRAIHAVSIDPNKKVLSVFQKSLKINNLSNRCQLINAAVDTQTGGGKFEFETNNIVGGHISNKGIKIDTISLKDLVAKSIPNKTVFKMDVEGYETILLPYLCSFPEKKGLIFMIEIHPQNFNDIGNPTQNLKVLLENATSVTDLYGKVVTNIELENFTQLIVEF